MTRHRLRLHSRQGKQHMTDIPLATILRINAARTIPLTRYEEEGNFDRFGYIKDLAENHGADLPAVLEIAELLDRKSVVEGESVSVRVDLGGHRISKKKQKRKKYTQI